MQYFSLLSARQNDLQDICLISDNAKVLHDIKFHNYIGSPHPYLIQSIIDLIDNSKSTSKILIKWMPGHCNHPFLQTVDHLAKQSSFVGNFNNITFTVFEALSILDAHIWDRWCKQWETNPTGSYQKLFKPTARFLTPNVSRRSDVTISRIRMLQSKLNAGLHKLGLHPDGNCEACGVEETSEHFLIKCIKTDKLRKEIFRRCTGLSIPLNFQELTSNKEAIDIIINYIRSENISV